MAKGIVFTPEKCIGCRICELVCTFSKYDDFNPKDAAIRVMPFDEEGLQVPLACIQCDEPECAAACPVDALVKNKETEVVEYNRDLCIDCKLCVDACPYDSITYSERLSRIIKCDLCGGDPECVKLCPSGALEFKELDSELKEKREKIAAHYSQAYKEVAK
ncbi:MAG: 4Fe-4S dicluster domain-containing protein [Tissierellia bacterium]|nr:4Fe-4S dicluster domain-containing protein [Tissierellia bacterium]